jgi:hypothetical protein
VPVVERRAFPRIRSEFYAQATGLLSKSLGIKREGTIDNLSETGAAFAFSHANGNGADPGLGFEVGDPIQLVFEITAAPFKMDLNGRVIHRSQNSSEIGIKFKNPSKEAREALRKYVG